MKDLETLFNVLLAAIEERLIAKSDLGLIRDQSLSYAGTLNGWRAELTFTDRAAFGGQAPYSYYSILLSYRGFPALFQSGSFYGHAPTAKELWEKVTEVALATQANALATAEPMEQRDRADE